MPANNFYFSGPISSSKSMMNRALIMQSYAPHLLVEGFSHCDDVIKMQEALKSLHQTTEFDCGEAGTVLRFLIFRISRLKGHFKLRGSERLFSRPQAELKNILLELGVETKWFGQHVEIRSQGWQKPTSKVLINRSQSSQFASGLLLNSFDLDFELEFRLQGPPLSEGYWQMTQELVRQVGLEFSHTQDCYRVPAGQKVKASHLVVEPDMSSIFAIASMAALQGEAEFLNFPKVSLQPDYIFLKIFEGMNIPFQYEADKKILRVQKSSRLTPFKMNLGNSPDLFPVLSVLCALTQGESHLYGAPHLNTKESRRIDKTSELLTWLGASHRVLPDGLRIHGRGNNLPQLEHLYFYPDQDHRMAMSAGILQRLGFPIEIANPEVVDKSFPEFWSILRGEIKGEK